MDDVSAGLREAFDPERFRTLGHDLIDRLADHLAAAESSRIPALPWREPQDILADWPAEFPAAGSLPELLSRYVAGANHLHHPGYVGHQVTSPLPEAALSVLTCALLNSGPVVYEMGPAAVAMERAVVGWMTRQLGWPEGADGVFTSGGSAGNLTALLAARQAKAGYDVWGEGEPGHRGLAVLVAETAHYSVSRALQVMGLGRRGAVPVACDESYRLRPEALWPAYQRAMADGLQPIAVVASSCCTPTGSFDPLSAVADFCAAHDLWLHIDGAHGAPAILSDTYRHYLDGVDRADSLVWDSHKMMLIPSISTAVLFRDGQRSYESFAQSASYLFAGRDPRDEWYNLGVRTLECTKPALATPLYVALATRGPAFFGDYVTARFDLGRWFGQRLADEPDFERPVAPDGNIVCFRWLPAVPVPDLDALQAEIRRRILASGRFHLVQTQLRSGLHLRVTIINPLTGREHLEALLETVRATGLAVIAGR